MYRILIIALMLAGCSSMPIGPEQAEQIPTEDLYYAGKALQAPAPDRDSEITVVRDSGGTTFGLAPGFLVILDGTQLVVIDRPGMKFSIFVSAGAHTIAVSRSATRSFGPPTASVQVMAQPHLDTVLHTGESPSGYEPLRIFVGETEPIQN